MHVCPDCDAVFDLEDADAPECPECGRSVGAGWEVEDADELLPTECPVCLAPFDVVAAGPARCPDCAAPCMVDDEGEAVLVDEDDFEELDEGAPDDLLCPHCEESLDIGAVEECPTCGEELV